MGPMVGNRTGKQGKDWGGFAISMRFVAPPLFQGRNCLGLEAVSCKSVATVIESLVALL